MIIIIIIIIFNIHNGNRSAVWLMHFPPSYKRLWARWRGLALKVNHNDSKSAIYKVINVLRGGMKEKRRKLLLCILRFISYRFVVFRYKLTLKWHQGKDIARGRRSKGFRAACSTREGEGPFPCSRPRNSLSFTFPTLEAEEKISNVLEH